MTTRVATTLRALLFKPGRLTIEFLEGRRRQYLPPIPLYLCCSVAYFVLAAVSLSSPSSTRLPTVLTKEQRDELLAQAALAPPPVKPILTKIAVDPQRFTDDVVATIPMAMFVLLPAFAGIVALFYRGRPFSVHLYFTLHVHAQLFIALCFTALANWTRLLWVGIGVGVAVLIWVPIYWHLALRAVYRGSNGITIVKELGISLLYALMATPVLGALIFWVAFH